MSDVKMVTEKDAVLRERLAFRSGWCCHRAYRVGYAPIDPEGEAARAYPLPKVTRPRVVMDARGVKWKVMEGRLHALEPHCDGWARADNTHWLLPPDRVSLWADLFANPTEEVDA
jgi:hypothetical protein